jgi:hypothetical protein
VETRCHCTLSGQIKINLGVRNSGSDCDEEEMDFVEGCEGDLSGVEDMLQCGGCLRSISKQSFSDYNGNTRGTR